VTTLDPRTFVDPVFFSRLENIELRARSIVEGFMHGLHRSPYVGYSVEFSSHREYVPGDDLRHVNWKLFARNKRLYVKEYDAETNLNLYIVLDISTSMECANSGRSKLHYGASLAAALAHLALKQHDAVGITLIADTVVQHLRPRSTVTQLQEICRVIASTKPRKVPQAAKALHAAAELASHRGLVVVISDLFDDVMPLMDGLEHFRFKNHEVLLFHILDPWERDLPLEGNIRFHDLETGEELITQAEAIREGYLKAVNEWKDGIEKESRNRSIDRIELTTADPLDAALLDYLVRRSQM
jgi:uncharacterized protein (DUF58 family)